MHYSIIVHNTQIFMHKEIHVLTYDAHNVKLHAPVNKPINRKYGKLGQHRPVLYTSYAIEMVHEYSLYVNTL